MYGTIGHFRIKAGMEAQFRELMEGQGHAFEAAQTPGFAVSYSYHVDADPSDYYLAVVFESRETYWANAQSPGQNARYHQWLPLLEGEPEWHDGEIVGTYALKKD
jgi:quinol monooxygenase YgiN